MVDFGMADSSKSLLHSKKAPKPFWILRLILLIGILAIPVGVLLYIPLLQKWSSFRNKSEFQRHGEEYKRLVQIIESLELPRNRTIYFSVSKSRDPNSLVQISPDSNPEYFHSANVEQLVSTLRKEDGNLLVKFITHSLGHAGLFGVVYSNGVPDPNDLLSVFGAAGQVTQVASNWWAIADYTQ